MVWLFLVAGMVVGAILVRAALRRRDPGDWILESARRSEEARRDALRKIVSESQQHLERAKAAAKKLET